MNEGLRYPAFLGLEPPLSSAEDAAFNIIPVPFEKTVSWGAGTAMGPSALLEASCQVELFNGNDSVCERGIHTQPPVVCGRSTSEEAVKQIAQAVTGVLERSAIPVVLGGEHTVTLGPVDALLAAGTEFGVVQFDAHADMRDEYEGDRLSHACVMRRVVDRELQLFQIANRSYCREEHGFRETHSIPYLNADHIAASGIPDTVLPRDFPENIYITFDVDALDPSIMAATGTPEPGGLTWYQALELLRKVIGGRRVVGFDVNELAPSPGLHACDFTAAKLTYEIMGMAAPAG